MRKQIVHISVHQTSKVIAAMHAAMISILFVLPTVLSHLFHKQVISAIVIFIVIPLLIWLFLYIGYVIACWFYNLLAPWTGGIEFEMVDKNVPQESITRTASEEVAVKPDKIIEAPPEQKL